MLSINIALQIQEKDMHSNTTENLIFLRGPSPFSPQRTQKHNVGLTVNVH